MADSKESFFSIKSSWQERIKFSNKTGNTVVSDTPEPISSPEARQEFARSPSGGGNSISSADSQVTVLGLTFQPAHDGKLQVSKIVPEGGTSLASMRVGDVLVEIDGTNVDDWPASKVNELLRSRSEKSVRLGIRRDNVPAVLHLDLQESWEKKENVGMNGTPSETPPTAQTRFEQMHAAKQHQPAPASPDEIAMEAASTRPSLEAGKGGEEGMSRDDAKTNVIRRYKLRVQELSHMLTESQQAVTTLHQRVQTLERELVQAKAQSVSQSQNKKSDEQEGGIKVSERERAAAEKAEQLQKEVQRLTTEIDRMRTEREVELLTALPKDDSSGLVEELQLQLTERDSQIKELESQVANMKRSTLQSAVEVQELQSHIQALEKRHTANMQAAAFPPLPKLESVREVLAEWGEGDEDRLNTMVMADNALRQAWEEIATLQKESRNKSMLESQLTEAQRELSELKISNMMRNASASKAAAADTASSSDSSDAPAPAPAAPAAAAAAPVSMSEEVAKMMLRQAQEQVSDLEERLAASEHSRRAFETENKGLRSELASMSARISTLNDRVSGLEAENEALLFAKEELDMAVFELKNKLQAAPPQVVVSAEVHTPQPPRSLLRDANGERTPPARDAAGLTEESSLWLQGQLREAKGVLAHAIEHIAELRKDTQGSALVALQGQHFDLQVRVDRMMTRLDELLTGGTVIGLVSTPGGANDHPQMHRSKSSPPVRVGGDGGAGTLQDEVEALRARVADMQRNEKFMEAEIDLATAALAKSRAQHSASEVECRVLRTQLEGAGSQAREQNEELAREVKALLEEVGQLQARNLDLSQQLDKFAAAGGAEYATTNNKALVQGLLSEKRELEGWLEQLKEQLRQSEHTLAEAQNDLRRLHMEKEAVTHQLKELLISNSNMEAKLQQGSMLEGKEAAELQRHVFTLQAEVESLRQAVYHGAQPGSNDEMLKAQVILFAQENASLKTELRAQAQRGASPAAPPLKPEVQREAEAKLARAHEEMQRMSQIIAARDQALLMNQHKMGVLADQLQSQKEKAARMSQDGRAAGGTDPYPQENVYLRGEIERLERELHVAKAGLREVNETVKACNFELQRKALEVESLNAIILRLEGHP